MTTRKHAWIKSSCEMCQFNYCGILVEVEDGVPVKIVGDPGSLYTQGKLCPKGLSGLMKLYDPLRVKSPLIRTNPQKGTGIDPKWREASWDEALNLVAAKFKKIRGDNPKKLIISGYPPQGFNLFEQWGAAFGTYCPAFAFGGVSNKCGNPQHFIDWITNDAGQDIMDIDYCNYVVLLGSQPGFGTNHATLQLAGKIADARARGMRLVVVSPALSPASAKADEWLPIRPGTDLALLLSMIYLLIHEYKIYDSEFLKKSTNAPYLLDRSEHYVRDPETGKPMVWDLKEAKAKTFDDPSIKDYALEGRYEVGGECTPAFHFLKDQVEQYKPKWASKITSLPEEQIRRVTREMAEYAQIGATISLEGKEYPFRPVGFHSFKAMGAHTNGGLARMAQEIIPMLLGSFGAVGGQLGKFRRFMEGPRLQPVGDDGVIHNTPLIGWWEDMYNKDGSIGRPFKFPPERVDLGDYCPLSLDNGHLVPLVVLEPKKYGFDFEPEALIIFHSNPLKNCGDLNIMTGALKKLDFVVDITAYLDETCDFVDVVLPEHCYLERYGITNDSYALVGIQVQQPVTKPLHNTMDGFDILTELAERTGFLYGEGGFNASHNRTWGLEDPYKLDLNRKYTWEAVTDLRIKCYTKGQKDLAWFKEHGNDLRRCKADELYRLYRKGRVPIYFSRFKEAGEKLEANLNKYQIREKLGLKFNMRQYTAVPYWEPTPLFADSEYDLYLIYYQHHMTSYADSAVNPILMELAENDPYLLTLMINEQTAARRGIKDADEVWIESRIAKTQGRVKLSQGIHPEVVAISAGFGRWLNHPVAKGKGVTYNDHIRLDLEYTGMIGGSTESAARVRITRVKEEETR